MQNKFGTANAVDLAPNWRIGSRRREQRTAPQDVGRRSSAAETDDKFAAKPREKKSKQQQQRQQEQQGEMVSFSGYLSRGVRVCWLLSVWFLLSARLAAAAGCSNELKSSLAMSPNATPEEVVHKVDRMIQVHAFRALLRPHTGTVYDVPLPMGIQPGLSVQAVRLKTGSLQHRGFIFNEFILPPRLSVTTRMSPGAEEVPEYVVLVYRFFSMRFSAYCPRNGVTIIGPVVGIRAYSGMDMEESSSGTNEPLQVEVVALEDPVTVRIPIFPLSDSNKVNPAMCALFDGNGNTTITPMTYINVCSMYQLGDATLVNFSGNNSGENWPDSMESPAPAPAPASALGVLPGMAAPPPSPSTDGRGTSSGAKGGILGAMGGVAVVALAAFLAMAGLRIHSAAKISKMEIQASKSESLGRTLISYNVRPPNARPSRTKPCLEKDYIFR